MPGNEALDVAEDSSSPQSEVVPEVDTRLNKRTSSTKSGVGSRRRKKQKVRTCARRRTEIEALTDELQALEKQMERYEHLKELLKQRRAVLRSEFMNRMMRDVLQTQRLSFASSVSMLSHISRDMIIRQFDLPTRLDRDPATRQVALLKMRHERLHAAHLYLLKRMEHLTMEEYCDRKRFKATNGDFVSSRFEMTPLPEARSIKAIFDALQTFVYNIEISISDAVGDVTVRENDDAVPDSPVAQHRLVTTFSDGTRVEANNVAFADYCPAGPHGSEEEETGLLVCDTVDEDDLFPYRPLERIRQDSTEITMISWHQREIGEPIIVITQWVCHRIRKSELYVPPSVMESIRTSVEKLGGAMISTARHAGSMPN